MGSNVTRHATHHDSTSPGRPAGAGHRHRRLARSDRPRRPGRRLTAVFATLAVALGVTGAGVVAPSGAAAAPSAYWPGHDVARRVVSNPAGTGGWTLNGFGAVNAFGGAPPLSGAPNWGSWDIARDLAVTSSGTGGYVLDGWGGIHRLGDAPPLAGAPYWHGFDIARRLVLNPAGSGGWVLDGWGGVHAFGGAALLSGGSYWRGWDIARDLVVTPSGTGGYVLDGWGGIHPLGDAPAVSGAPYWPGWDIARKLVLNPVGPGGWVLDGWGGVHRFEGAPTVSGVPNWTGWDIARDLAIDSTGARGYLLDGWGGLHDVSSAAAPSNTAVPVVSGVEKVGEELSTTDGTWWGTAPITFTYQWQRCDDAAASTCSDIAGATGATYALTGDDEALFVRVELTATNGVGSRSVRSDATGAIATDEPRVAVAPQITGIAREGEVLATTDGTWTGLAPITITYQWGRADDLAWSNWVQIPGATGNTYTLTGDDVGKYVFAFVTGTNSLAAATAATELTGPVATAAVAPINTVAPSISGTATDGAVLSTTDGTWTGTAPLTFSYRWQRCDDDVMGLNCVNIGTDSSSYTLTAAEVGKYVKVGVTATNAAGSAMSWSPFTGLVASAPGAPSNTAPPVISGTATDGAVLSTTDGTWTGTAPLTFSYRWQRCDDDVMGLNCVNIGTDSSSYTLTAAEVGKYVKVGVTATNTAGSALSWSLFTGVVASAPAAAPANTVLPVVTGTWQQGATITTTDGTWTGTAPITFGYQWERCDYAGGYICADIAAATGSTYVLVPDDVGKYIRMTVTATNADGIVAASSAPVGPIEPPPSPPVAVGLPTVWGDPIAGATLSADSGSWTSSDPITYTYQWQRCVDAAGVTCTDIPGATGNSYTLTAADVGLYVAVKVTATNGAGTNYVASVPLGPIA